MGNVVLYKWDDTGAPQLSYAAGSALALFDACLVNGYGSKAGAGWTKSFTDSTNKRTVYKQGGTTGRHFFQVYDNSEGFFSWAGYETMTDTVTGTNCFVGGNTHSTSHWGTGTTVTTTSTCRHLKSNYSGYNAKWYLIADDRTFYFFVRDERDPYFCSYMPMMFGDIYSMLPGDLYKCAGIGGYVQRADQTVGGFWISHFANFDDSGATDWITGHSTSTYVVTGNNNLVYWSGSSGSAALPNRLQAISRSYDGVTQSMFITKGWSNLGLRNGITTPPPKMGGQSSNLRYPDPVSGRLILSPVYINEKNLINRGFLRGLYAPCHFMPIPGEANIITGAGNMAGKEFLSLPVQASYSWNAGNTSASYPGQVFIETTSGWQTSQ